MRSIFHGLLLALVLLGTPFVVALNLQDFAGLADAITREIGNNLGGVVPQQFIVVLMVAFWPSLILGYGLSFVPSRWVGVPASLLLCLVALVYFVPLIIGFLVILLMDLRSRVMALAAFEIDAPLGIGHLGILPLVTFALGWIGWRLLKPGRRVDLMFRNDVEGGQPGKNPLDTTFGAILLISVLIIAVQFLYHPVVLTEHVYRALLLPFLLGLLVPLFTFISYWSFRWHAPIVVVAILIIAFLTPDTADVRTLQKDGERQTLEAAVSQWAKANGCDVAVTDPEGKCPSPIIVSVAGGASRSAFLFGAVVGKLLDETHAKDGTPLRPFGAQLFAISGVSGGSFGASVTYAALADSITKGGGSRGQAAAPPCKPQVHDTEWFGHHMHPEPHPETSWRACLESILAGDFLSPVMVSLFTTDLVGIAPRGDRAVILENAWERRYAHYTGQDPETTTLAQPLIRCGARRSPPRPPAGSPCCYWAEPR